MNLGTIIDIGGFIEAQTQTEPKQQVRTDDIGSIEYMVIAVLPSQNTYNLTQEDLRLTYRQSIRASTQGEDVIAAMRSMRVQEIRTESCEFNSIYHCLKFENAIIFDGDGWAAENSALREYIKYLHSYDYLTPALYQCYFTNIHQYQTLVHVPLEQMPAYGPDITLRCARQDARLTRCDDGQWQKWQQEQRAAQQAAGAGDLQ